MAEGGVEGRRPLHYVRGNWFGANVLNRAVLLLARLGVSLWDSRVLRVRGRRTGRVYTTPVNLLVIDGQRYLVAPRGHTQWVRNVRAAGGGELQLGRRVERFQAIEVPDDVKVPILRAYLRRWKFEVGMFFGGVGPDSPPSWPGSRPTTRSSKSTRIGRVGPHSPYRSEEEPAIRRAARFEQRHADHGRRLPIPLLPRRRSASPSIRTPNTNA